MALCAGCGVLSRLSELNYGLPAQDLLNKFPAGCSIEEEVSAVTLTASTRSIGGAIGLTAAALFWNGITSVFLMLAVAGLYSNLIGPLPNWFPAMGAKNGRPQLNDADMTLGGTLFLCAFITPFVLVGIGMIVGVLMNLFGKVKLRIDGADSYVATGFWGFRWKRRFDMAGVTKIAQVKQARTENDSKLIEISTSDKKLRFGSQLADERQQWIVAVTKEILKRSQS